MTLLGIAYETVPSGLPPGARGFPGFPPIRAPQTPRALPGSVNRHDKCYLIC